MRLRIATGARPARTIASAGAAASPCGNVDAIGTNARFGAPYGLAVSPLDGSQWVADGTYHRIRRIAPSAAGSFVTHHRGLDSP